MPPLWNELSNSYSNNFYNYNDNGLQMTTIMGSSTDGTTRKWWIPGIIIIIIIIIINYNTHTFIYIL